MVALTERRPEARDSKERHTSSALAPAAGRRRQRRSHLDRRAFGLPSHGLGEDNARPKAGDTVSRWLGRNTNRSHLQEQAAGEVLGLRHRPHVRSTPRRGSKESDVAANCRRLRPLFEHHQGRARHDAREKQTTTLRRSARAPAPSTRATSSRTAPRRRGSFGIRASAPRRSTAAKGATRMRTRGSAAPAATRTSAASTPRRRAPARRPSRSQRG